MEPEQNSYEAQKEKTDAYFRDRIGEASKRSYEYGVLVVKNAFLVAGGGLFLTPALVQLNKEAELAHAACAGLLFAVAVMLALLANYVIHVNWMNHELVWENYRQQDNIRLLNAFGYEGQGDEQQLSALELKAEKLNRRIEWTFRFPHVLAVLYVCLFVAACFQLYKAMGISAL